MVPLPSHKVSRVSWYSGSRPFLPGFAYGAFTLSGWLSQNHSATVPVLMTVHTPRCTHHGLGSFPFARRYSGNRCFFLFLRLLRCFSSPGSLPCVMDWRMDDRSFSCRVSPFRHLRVYGYVLLTAAYRSLSRLSSALSAKASTLRSLYLDQFSHSFRCFAVWLSLHSVAGIPYIWPVRVDSYFSCAIHLSMYFLEYP